MQAIKRGKQFLLQPAFYPILLFLTGLICYIISLPALGFYWDDWQAVFLYQTHQPALLQPFFQFDRPFSAWTYALTFPLVPITPFAWQLFTLLTRWAAVWALTEAFILIWQERAETLRWAGVLLLVFPGFSLQPVSVAFNQHFITFLLFSLSIYWMVKGVQCSTRQRWLWLGLSLVTALGHIVTMEYFIGLEAVRPLLLWFALRQSSKERPLKRSLAHAATFALPFILITAGFLFWRLQIYPMQNASVDDPNKPVLLERFSTAPVDSLVKLGDLAAQDSIYLLTYSWLRGIDPEIIQLDAKFNWVAWVVGLLVAGLYAGWSVHNAQPQKLLARGNPFNQQALVSGLLAMFMGGLPVWITGRQILEGKWSDRFSLAPMLGVVLVVVAVLDWLIRTRYQKNVALAALLSLSVSFQLMTTHKFTLDWELQREFYWQLAWRVPAIKPGTAFFSARIPTEHSSRYSIGFALNTLYGGDVLSAKLPYWYFSPADEGRDFSKLALGSAIEYVFRNLTFTGSTSDGLAYMHKPTSGCLLLLTPAYAGNPAMDETHAPLAALTNLERMDLTNPATAPNANIFGPEPDHDWCYYFEKADLARQQSDWNGVLKLMQDAQSKGLKPKSGVENLPALEATFYLQDWPAFVEISQKTQKSSVDLNYFLCTQWQRLEKESGMGFPEPVRAELNTLMDCSKFPITTPSQTGTD